MRIFLSLFVLAFLSSVEHVLALPLPMEGTSSPQPSSSGHEVASHSGGPEVASHSGGHEVASPSGSRRQPSSATKMKRPIGGYFELQQVPGLSEESDGAPPRSETLPHAGTSHPAPRPAPNRSQTHPPPTPGIPLHTNPGSHTHSNPSHDDTPGSLTSELSSKKLYENPRPAPKPAPKPAPQPAPQPAPRPAPPIPTSKPPPPKFESGSRFSGHSQISQESAEPQSPKPQSPKWPSSPFGSFFKGKYKGNK